MIADRFGFLPCDWRFDFDGGSISPIPEIYQVRNQVEKCTNDDGFIFPPSSYRVELNVKTNKILRKIPKTRRPAHFHPVPPSHELYLNIPGFDLEALLKDAAAVKKPVIDYEVIVAVKSKNELRGLMAQLTKQGYKCRARCS